MKKGITKSKNMIMLITIGVIVLAIGLIALVGSMNSKGKDAAPSVEVVSVGTGNVTQEVDATGNVESEQKKTFYSPVNGTIQTMTAEAGDSVDAGKSIIGFNLEDLEAENQEAQLTAKSGELDIKDAQEQASTAANKVAEAQAAIPGLESQIEEKQNQINSLRQQIADAQTNAQNDAQAQIEQAQAEAKAEADAAYDAAVAAADQEYQKALDEYNNVTKKDYDQKLSDLKTKIDSGTAAESELEDYRYLLNNPPAEPVKKEVNQADYSVSTDGLSGTVTADTSDLQAQMETASSDLAQLQSDLASKKAIAENDTAGLTDAAREKMAITSNLSELKSKNLQELLEEGRKGIQAEFKGVISDAKVTQGATVTQGMELFTLQSTQDVCVEANVSKYDFDKVKEGQKAEITLGDKKYKGTVDKVSKIAIPNEKGTPLIGVSVHIDNPDDDIFIGVEAKVTIQASEAKNVPVLPVEVVNIGKEGSFCYVVNKGKIEKKDIETGVTSDSMVEVKSGLKKGDQVIKDMGNYSEGDSVTAKEAKTEDSKASK
ncbi:efflux RND transporter periplasmic adaptor subunit [Blautia sp. HA2174]|uniref:efflux RND transporter periplasmic adaptor subunit n=1 Tax=unclassified Blautia TaxID=2648079 RepID=UPI0025E45A05|nr:efflux RND transporter periplasmic adaptor subunit [uncultured Blautia sp.]